MIIVAVVSRFEMEYLIYVSNALHKNRQNKLCRKQERREEYLGNISILFVGSSASVSVQNDEKTWERTDRAASSEV